MGNTDRESRELFCGNLDRQVDDELLYELFTQAGPLEDIVMPLDRRTGSTRGFAIIIFKHECSVPYAMHIFEDTLLFGKLPTLQVGRRAIHQRSRSTPSNFMHRATEFELNGPDNVRKNESGPVKGIPLRITTRPQSMRMPMPSRHPGRIMTVGPPPMQPPTFMGPPAGAPMGPLGAPMYSGPPGAPMCTGASMYSGQPGAPMYTGAPGAPMYSGAPMYTGPPGAPMYSGAPGAPMYTGPPGAPMYMGPPGAPMFMGPPSRPLLMGPPRGDERPADLEMPPHPPGSQMPRRPPLLETPLRPPGVDDMPPKPPSFEIIPKLPGADDEISRCMDVDMHKRSQDSKRPTEYELMPPPPPFQLSDKSMKRDVNGKSMKMCKFSKSSSKSNFSKKDALPSASFMDQSRPSHRPRRENNSVYGNHRRAYCDNRGSQYSDSHRASSYDCYRGGSRYEGYDNYRPRDKSYENRDSRDRSGCRKWSDSYTERNDRY